MSGPGTVPVAGARPAEPSDAEVLRCLAAEARASVVEARGGLLWAQHDVAPDPFGPGADGAGEGPPAWTDPDRLRLVGTLDGHVVGYLLAAVSPTHDGRRLARVTELYVEPDARELGVGEALLAEAIDWARRGGCLGVDSSALPGDRATKNFFEAAGLVARAIVVHRPLEPPAP